MKPREKGVSSESKQRFKLRGENISIQEKQAMPYQHSLYKETNEECLSGSKAHAGGVLSEF